MHIKHKIAARIDPEYILDIAWGRDKHTFLPCHIGFAFT